jgi:hypothetical protein
MSYQERRAIASLISTILMSAGYFVYVFQRYPAGSPYSPEVFRFWGWAMLVFIPVSILVNIAIEIGFSIFHTMATNEKERALIDERDKLIGLRASRNGMYVFAVGYLLAMGALAAGMPPGVMFGGLVVSGFLSVVVAHLSQLYFYRSGIQDG